MLAFTVVTLPLLLLVLGVVVDAGMFLLQKQMLDAATDAAAKAATDAWDREHWKWTGKVVIPKDPARVLARQYLDKNGKGVRLVALEVSPPNRVTLHTEADVRFFFLSSVGLQQVTLQSFSSSVRRDH